MYVGVLLFLFLFRKGFTHYLNYTKLKFRRITEHKLFIARINLQVMTSSILKYI